MATASVPHARRPAPPVSGGEARRVPAAPDRTMRRVAAVTGVLGVLTELVAGHLHPAQAQPNDSRAAFLEYSRSGSWTGVHIAQYAGVLLLAITLLTLARVAGAGGGWPGALAMVGAVAVLLVAAVFAVQMAVDGVALKGAIRAWVDAPGGVQKAAAFTTAEAVRSLEKGLGGFFQMLDGVAFLTIGLAIALGRRVWRWLGWLGAVVGVGLLVGGALTAQTGFSTTASTVLTVPGLLLSVFVLGAAVWLWRQPAP